MRVLKLLTSLIVDLWTAVRGLFVQPYVTQTFVQDDESVANFDVATRNQK